MTSEKDELSRIIAQQRYNIKDVKKAFWEDYVEKKYLDIYRKIHNDPKMAKARMTMVLEEAKRLDQKRQTTMSKVVFEAKWKKIAKNLLKEHNNMGSKHVMNNISGMKLFSDVQYYSLSEGIYTIIRKQQKQQSKIALLRSQGKLFEEPPPVTATSQSPIVITPSQNKSTSPFRNVSLSKRKRKMDLRCDTSSETLLDFGCTIEHWGTPMVPKSESLRQLEWN